MSDFSQYQEPAVPTTVRLIEIYIRSTMHEGVDENGDPLPDLVETETIEARASVLDQNGVEQWVHYAPDHQTLLDKGVLTQAQLQNAQAFVQAFRDAVEGKVLPTT